MIRPATSADLENCGAIARAAYAPYVADIGAEPPPMLQDFAADLAEGALWVTGDPAEGYLVARPKETDWLIENVAIAPEAQGRGLGGALIRFAEAEGARRGFAKAVLYTNLHMKPNLKMYPAMSYQEVGRWRENGMDRVFFAKEIG